MFKLNQDVKVKGKRAVFIGYMHEGRDAQVCIVDERKRNVIVALGEIAPVTFGSKTPRPKAESVEPVADLPPEGV